MSKTSKQRRSTENFGATHLSAEERIALSAADADAAVAAAEAERDLARLQARQLQLEMFRLEAEKNLTDSRARAAETRAVRRKLADELADRYAINWSTHVLEPMTGAIVPLESEKEAGHAQP